MEFEHDCLMIFGPHIIEDNDNIVVVSCWCGVNQDYFCDLYYLINLAYKLEPHNCKVHQIATDVSVSILDISKLRFQIHPQIWDFFLNNIITHHKGGRYITCI